jgi:hypothetical protein
MPPLQKDSRLHVSDFRLPPQEGTSGFRHPPIEKEREGVKEARIKIYPFSCLLGVSKLISTFDTNSELTISEAEELLKSCTT